MIDAAPAVDFEQNAGAGSTAAAESSQSDAAGTAPKSGGRRRATDGLMALTEPLRLAYTVDGEAYASLPGEGHRQLHPISGLIIGRWLASTVYRELGTVPGAAMLDDVKRILEAKAFEDGILVEPWLRAGSANGRLYIALHDEDRRVVEIGTESWQVIAEHNLPIVKAPGMRALPEPEGGCEIDVLRRFVNVATDADFDLVVAWLVAALRDRGPYPILVIAGEQGTGKSNAARLLRSLVDPSVASVRTVPRDDRDLIIAASNSHVLSYDNLSGLPGWIADAFCRLATGGGFSTRQLHTDRQEIIFQATRPIILNGIALLTDRADLADRSLTIRLKPIAEEDRRTEEDFWSDWAAVAPRVLGTLCDALSAGLRNIGNVHLTSVPRMADFAKWMVAAEPGLGWAPGTFMAAYRASRRDQADSTFEADPVAVAITELVPIPGQLWSGTATELLGDLSNLVTEAVRKTRAWPATAQGLGNRIDRVAPLLRGRGISIDRRHSGVRTITITCAANEAPSHDKATGGESTIE